MKRLLISGFVTVALLGFATTLRSHWIISEGRSNATNHKIGKSPAHAGDDMLLIEEFEDMTFVFSTPVKH